TIIKIKHVKQNETKDTKSISVWAIGSYPIGLKDNDIEVVLYVPRNHDEQDPDLQAMFRRDEYYSMSVATSTHLTSRASDSNKCPLKVSLIGTAQGNPTVIESTNDSTLIIQTPSLTTSSDIESEPSGKHKRSKEIDQLIDLDIDFDCKSKTNESNSVKTNQREPEKPKLLIRTTHSPKKSRHTTVKDAESDKE
ncbi:10703_t:CDS:2, partial [Gigaspora rosea]